MGLSSRLSTPSFPPPDPPTSPSDCPSRTSTKSEVLAQCPWAEWRLASSSPAWSSPPLPTSLPPRSSPWRCTTSLCPRPSLETMLASTSRTSPSRTKRGLLQQVEPVASICTILLYHCTTILYLPLS